MRARKKTIENSAVSKIDLIIGRRIGQEFMYRNRCFVFCFVCEITGESEKCNLMEACRATIAISGDRNFVMVLIRLVKRLEGDHLFRERAW